MSLLHARSLPAGKMMGRPQRMLRTSTAPLISHASALATARPGSRYYTAPTQLKVAQARRTLRASPLPAYCPPTALGIVRGPVTQWKSIRTLLTRSFARGWNEPPLLEHTIPQHFDEIVSRYGDRPAVISYHQDQSLTYKQLQEQSNAIARGLQEHGVKKGDRVCVSMGNCMEFATITYSLFRLGAILVPLNPGFSPTQVAAALNHLSAAHLVTGVETNLPFRPPKSNMPLFTALLDDINSSTIKSTTVPSLTHVIVADNAAEPDHNTFQKVPALIPFENLRSPDTSFPSVEELHSKEVTNIQFTSGTTSAPKAAMLTHSNVLNNGYFIGNGLELTETDIICCPPPLFHCFGCVLGYSATATHGSAILFSNYSFDPKASLEATAKYRATGLYGVPTMFLSMLALLNSGELDLPEDGFSRLRTGIAAGSSVPAEVMHKLHRRLNLRDLAICYGMTETSPVSCMTTSADSMEARCETVGKTMPHVRTKVVDPVTREIVPIGERGELAVAGYLVMTGYWGDEKKTQEALVPALDDPADPTSTSRTWMLTGDEASMDAEGYVRITGRIKDLIIRGGENISPLEIENCLLSMDEVEDVSVVGVKDAHYGEVVGAFIIQSAAGRDLSDEQIRNWVKERLSKHLVPRHVFFIDTFPKTTSGKVQKFELRRQAEELVKKAPAGNDDPNLR